MGVKIGCSSAFWGDSITAAHQLVKYGGINYLVADYLAEVTMGILAKARQRKEKRGGAGDGGYVAEFITFVWKPLMADIMKQNIRVITNAGGLNPVGLKAAIEQAAVDAGLDQIPCVAAIDGDDILSNLGALRAGNKIKPFPHISGDLLSEEFLPSDVKKIESLNAYIGADPIRKALDAGAQIIVTGRCVDSAIVLGALMHEYKWKLTDYDLLAAGSLAGHIIECGCQATGGNFTDWELSALSKNGGWANMGYPIVDCDKNGTFVVMKTPKTGGLVSVGTVSEQMVYEIGDPASYILPDVVVDLTGVTLKQLDSDKVHVSGARGRPPTPYLKVSGIYMDGFKVTGELFIGGLEAKKKAETVGKAIVVRASKLIKKLGMGDFRATKIETLGSEYTYGEHAKHTETREVVLRLTAHHDELRALNVFLMEIAPSATCMAPGIIGVSGGRPRPTGNMVHFAVLVPKLSLVPRCTVGPGNFVINCPFAPNLYHDLIADQPLVLPPMVDKYPPSWTNSPKVKIPLIAVCLARSGDKGDSANIGVISRNPMFYPYLNEILTENLVAEYMKHLLTPKSVVKKYLLPGSFSFNFFITKCLGGGGLSSLQIDRQGKSYAQLLLSMHVEIPAEWMKTFSSKL